jgi:hypothetical protein
MGNDISELEKALAETWKSKERFYEKYKGLSALEILNRIEQKHAKETLDKSVHHYNAHGIMTGVRGIGA